MVSLIVAKKRNYADWLADGVQPGRTSQSTAGVLPGHLRRNIFGGLHLSLGWSFSFARSGDMGLGISRSAALDHGLHVLMAQVFPRSVVQPLLVLINSEGEVVDLDQNHIHEQPRYHENNRQEYGNPAAKLARVECVKLVAQFEHGLMASFDVLRPPLPIEPLATMGTPEEPIWLHEVRHFNFNAL